MSTKLEKELPMFLRIVAHNLSIGIPFEKALEKTTTGFGPLSKEMKKVLRQVKNGSSIPEALNEMLKENNTKLTKRAIAQLINSYESNSSHDALRSLAKEITLIQKNEVKRYSSQLMIYSLAFIAISAIIPALFQAIAIIGSSFMNLNITPEQALLIPVLVFPIADLLLIIFIKSKEP